MKVNMFFRNYSDMLLMSLVWIVVRVDAFMTPIQRGSSRVFHIRNRHNSNKQHKSIVLTQSKEDPVLLTDSADSSTVLHDDHHHQQHEQSNQDWSLHSQQQSTPPPPPSLIVVSNTINTVSAILEASHDAIVAAEATFFPTTTSSIQQNDTYDDTSNLIFDKNTIPLTIPELPSIVHTDTIHTDSTSPVTSVSTTTGIDRSGPLAPSVRKIVLFAIPAIGVWLCNPLLSLIDTSAVGILSGTIQQAALNPAVAITDYSAMLMAFLYTGTTNLIAAAHVKDQHTSVSTSKQTTPNTLIGVLQLSIYVGIGLGSILFLVANPLLRTLVGNDTINPAVFDAAMKYIRIRALGMPPAAFIGSAQAACLGIQDIKSPLYVLATAAIINFLGDVCFVGSNHPWIGGAAGAAWATVFSQYAAAIMFVAWLRNKPISKGRNVSSIPPNTLNNNLPSDNRSDTVTVNLSKAILELTSSKSTKASISRRQRFVNAVRSLIMSTSIARAEEQNQQQEMGSLDKDKDTTTSSARGFLEGKLRTRDMMSLPNRETIKKFAPYIIPVTTTVIGRISGYVAMSHVVSSSLGTISMAAQQIIVSLFYCLCPIADSLSLTAQSFFPSISESDASPQRSLAMKQTALNFFKAGSVFSGIIVAVVCCIPLLSGLFTTDSNVISLVNMVVPYLMGFFAVHGLVCANEGLLLGRKDLGFLGKMYAGFFVVVPALMLQVKRAALSGASMNITDVWKIFMGYQIFRSFAWSLRLLLLQRQTEKESFVAS